MNQYNHDLHVTHPKNNSKGKDGFPSTKEQKKNNYQNKINNFSKVLSPASFKKKKKSDFPSAMIFLEDYSKVKTSNNQRTTSKGLDLTRIT